MSKENLAGVRDGTALFLFIGSAGFLTDIGLLLYAIVSGAPIRDNLLEQVFIIGLAVGLLSPFCALIAMALSSKNPKKLRFISFTTYLLCLLVWFLMLSGQA